MSLNQNLTSKDINLVSQMAENLIPSEIIKLGNEINARKSKGEQIYNLTIGDFDPQLFPIPVELRDFIIQAYMEGHTNYPAANGVQELRNVLSKTLKEQLDLSYSSEEILISGGSRPLIYAVYQTILDPGDKVIYAVPSWNNNHYCHLNHAAKIELEVGPEQNFMPRAEDIKPFIEDAYLLALCSPQNPTGTVFSKEVLMDISIMVLEENKRRKGVKKPLYILYDQIYWQLTFGGLKHEDPVQLVPELRDYVIYIDGLSKVYAATGVRVGWSFGPLEVINKMRAILSHVGAWAPKAEQIATARFLENPKAVNDYLNWFKPQVELRLRQLFEGFDELHKMGLPIEVIPPQAAIYLTIRFPLVGKTTKEGKRLNVQTEVTQYILDECHVAMVPFKAFGGTDQSEWYRISVGTLKLEDIPIIIGNIRKGLEQLH